MSAEDPAKLGNMAVARGWVSPAQISECLDLQKSRSSGAAQPALLGEILLERKYLTPERLQWLLLHQERYIVECPHCKARLLAPELPPGTKTHCTKCRKPLVLAGPGQSPRAAEGPVRAETVPPPPPIPEDPMIGREIGGYRVEGKLGAGGMGIVYKARQIALDRTVALKFLKAEGEASTDFIERFKREAQAAARLNHTNVIQVYDAGHEGDTLFFSMEFVEGETLSSVLDRQDRIPAARALRIVREVAKALAYAHQHGVIHRDIKPDNILVTKDGGVKLADLGLAKVKDTQEAHKSLTISGEVMGTPYYMSPEQTRDTRSVDARSDIYSLGATFYRMVTGEPPFPGNSPFEVMANIQKGPVPNASERFPDVPWVYAQLIMKTMATDPAGRFQSATEFLKHSEAVERGSTAFPPTRGTPAASARPPGAPRTALVAAAVLGGLGLAALGFIAGRVSAERPPSLAAPGKSAAVAPTARPAAPPVPAPVSGATAPELDPAEAYFRLLAGFQTDRPRDVEGQKALLRRALSDPLLDTGAPYGKKLAEMREEIERNARRMAEDDARLAALDRHVNDLCRAGSYAQALDAEALALEFPGATGLPAYAELLKSLPARVEREAREDYRRVLETLLAQSIPHRDRPGAERLLRQAAERFLPFPSLRIGAESLLREIDHWMTPEPDASRPEAVPVQEEPVETPSEDRPDKASKKKKLKKRTYFTSSSQFKEDWTWDLPNPDPKAPKPSWKIENQGFSYRPPHEMRPPDHPGPGGEQSQMFPPLRYRNALVEPGRIQLVWTPRSRENASLRVFLCEDSDNHDGKVPAPLLELRSTRDDIWCFSPLLDDRQRPERTILDPAPGGYRITIEIPDREEREAKIRITITPESKKKGARTLEFPPPGGSRPAGEFLFAVMLAPDDILGPVEFQARDFRD